MTRPRAGGLSGEILCRDLRNAWKNSPCWLLAAGCWLLAAGSFKIIHDRIRIPDV
ncbi:hypothetical protein A225_5704 [Klebsiella michiganensis E718]|nr:hypothetical protein A225_5704 [Klebsiella michiganensis E718]